MSAAAVGARPHDALADAEEALARGDGIAAEVAAKRALDAGGSESDLAAVMGEAELLQGDVGAARRWLSPGRFAAATRERGFHALAKLEMIEGNFGAASTAFDRALESGSGSASLWADIGRLRYRLGQHHQALAAAIHAVEVDPADPRAVEFRGQLLRDARGPRAALPWFERGLEEAPNDFGLLGEYAATLGEAGRHRDMLAAVRRMAEIDPRNPRVYFLQAVLAARAGRDDLARRLMWRTDGAFDQDPAGRLLGAVLELRGGNPELAVDQLEVLSQQQPDNAMVSLLLGRALLASGEAGEVTARLGPAADRPKASPYLLTLVGRAYEHLGQREKAAQYLDRAAGAPHLGPGVLAARDDPESGAGGEVQRVRKLLAHGGATQARAVAAQLVAHYPGSIDVELLAGDAALLAGDAPSALRYYQRVVEVRRDLALVERMAAAHGLAAQPRAAMAVAADYAAQNPRSGPAAAFLGRMLAERGDWAKARVLLNYAARLDRGRGDPLLLADLSVAQLAVGRGQNAIDNARRAYGLQRANSSVTAILARTLQTENAPRAESEVLLAKARDRAAPGALAGR